MQHRPLATGSETVEQLGRVAGQVIAVVQLFGREVSPDNPHPLLKTVIMCTMVFFGDFRR